MCPPEKAVQTRAISICSSEIQNAPHAATPIRRPMLSTMAALGLGRRSSREGGMCQSFLELRRVVTRVSPSFGNATAR